MIYTSNPKKDNSKQLIIFLKKKIGLSDNAIALGITQSEREQAPLPIVLWSFGLLSIDQYHKVINWQSNKQP